MSKMPCNEGARRQGTVEKSVEASSKLQWKRKLLVSFLEPNEVELFSCQMVLDQYPERKTNTTATGWKREQNQRVHPNVKLLARSFVEGMVHSHLIPS